MPWFQRYQTDVLRQIMFRKNKKNINSILAVDKSIVKFDLERLAEAQKLFVSTMDFKKRRRSNFL